MVGLAKAARIFNIPTTITTVETQSFSGNTFPELLAVFPGRTTSSTHFDELPGTIRTSATRWRRNAANGRKKIVVSGLWTEVWQHHLRPSLPFTMVPEYEIYMVADASGGTFV